jgi:hypothetical protein
MASWAACFFLRQRLSEKCGPGTVGLVVAAEPVQAASDVELNVAIGYQAIGKVVGGKGVFEAFLLIGAIAT